MATSSSVSLCSISSSPIAYLRLVCSILVCLGTLAKNGWLRPTNTNKKDGNISTNKKDGNIKRGRGDPGN